MVDIFTRQSWDARRARRSHPQGPPTQAFLHHSADVSGKTYNTFAKQCAKMRAVQNFHMDDPSRRWDDIGYSFVVFQHLGVQAPRIDPRIFTGRGSSQIPAAQEDYNTGTLAICVVGDGVHEALAPATVKAIADLIRRYPTIKRLRGHDQNPEHPHETECPGKRFKASIPTIARAAGVSH